MSQYPKAGPEFTNYDELVAINSYSPSTNTVYFHNKKAIQSIRGIDERKRIFTQVLDSGVPLTDNFKSKFDKLFPTSGIKHNKQKLQERDEMFQLMNSRTVDNTPFTSTNQRVIQFLAQARGESTSHKTKTQTQTQTQTQTSKKKPKEELIYTSKDDEIDAIFGAPDLASMFATIDEAETLYLKMKGAEQDLDTLLQEMQSTGDTPEIQRITKELSLLQSRITKLDTYIESALPVPPTTTTVPVVTVPPPITPTVPAPTVPDPTPASEPTSEPASEPITIEKIAKTSRNPPEYHLNAIELMFGSRTNPQWNFALQDTIKKMQLTKREIIEFNKGIVEVYGKKIQVLEVLSDGDKQEFLELKQLEMGWHNGTQNVLIPLKDLLGLGGVGGVGGVGGNTSNITASSEVQSKLDQTANASRRVSNALKNDREVKSLRSYFPKALVGYVIDVEEED